MSKSGRKGRVSNELVAASFAAVLTIYGTGYWRTRDAARRFGTDTQQRHPPATGESSGGLSRAVPVAAPQTSEAAEGSTDPVLEPVASETEAAPLPAKIVAPSLQLSAVKPAAAPTPATLAANSVPVTAEEKVEAAAPPVAAAADAPDFRTPPDVTWHDGYYTGWGQSFHGDIEARVTIRDGKIVEAGIARCETRYPCSVVDNILNQPVQRQSPDVDQVSRATESSDAYYFGLIQALKKAEAEPVTSAVAP